METLTREMAPGVHQGQNKGKAEEKQKKKSQVQHHHAPGIRSVVEQLSTIHNALCSIHTAENK